MPVSIDHVPVDTVYTIMYQRIHVKIRQKLISRYGTACQQMIQIVPIKTAPFFQHHKRYVLFRRDFKQTNRVLQRGTAMFVNPIYKLADTPLSNISGSLINIQ